MLRREHDLRLRDERHQATFGCQDTCLPNHGALAAMDGRAFGSDFHTGRRGSDEIGLAFDGGCGRACRQIQHCRDGAERVGEGHRRAAVEDRRASAEIVAH